MTDDLPHFLKDGCAAILMENEKAYGCCRIDRGTRSCAVLRTVIETARKQ